MTICIDLLCSVFNWEQILLCDLEIVHPGLNYELDDAHYCYLTKSPNKLCASLLLKTHFVFYNRVSMYHTMFNFFNAGHVIEREFQISTKGMKIVTQRSVEEMDTDFQMSDIMYFTKSGIEV